MKPIIIDISEMSDSVDIYEAQPSRIVAYYIYSIVFFVVIITTWMCISKIDITVKGSGIFRNEASSSDISITTGGIVSTCNIIEGDYVDVGDEILIIEDDEIENTIISLQNQFEDIESRIQAIEAYISFLDGEKNALDRIRTNRYYSEFYEKSLLYELNNDNSKTSIQIEDEIKSCNLKINEYEKKIEMFLNAKECISCKQNMIDEKDGYYFTLVENYLADFKLTETKYNAQIVQIQNETEDVRKTLSEEKKAALDNLEISFNKEIEQNIDTLKMEIDKLESDISTYQKKLESQKDDKTLILTNLQEKQSVISELNNYKSKKEEIENSMGMYDLKAKKAKVIANTSGYVYFIQNISKGSYLATGSIVCKIIPPSSSNLYAEIYVSNTEIARLKEEQEVKIKASGYSATEHGEITGKIDFISKEIRLDENSGNAYFLVRVSCDNIKSINNNWDTGQIINGMIAEARIIVGEKNVLQYVLEKINIWISS